MELRKVLRAKLHGATVTQADVQYEGSITIPPELLDASGLVAYEAVWVWNVSSGTRFETYIIEGKSRSADICVNGAAAHLVTPGDVVIIAAFQHISSEALSGYQPVRVFLNSDNSVKFIGDEVAGPNRRQDQE